MEYLESGPIAALFQAVGIRGTRKWVPEPHLIRSIYRMLEAGRRVVVFPEGGRRWDGRPAPWIASTAKLFMRAGAPVYPVEIIGSYVAWPRWAAWPRPAHIKVKVHPAVDFSGAPTVEEALRRLQAPIASDETAVPEHVRPGWAFRPAVGIDRLLYRDPVTGEFGGVKVTDGHHISMGSQPSPWRVLPDSRLRQHPGEASISSADVYKTIRSLPLPDGRDKPMLTTRAVTWISGEGSVSVHSAHRVQEAKAHGLQHTDLALYHDHIAWGETSIALEDIRYMGMERSDRLWIIGHGVQRNAHFSHGSVLAWYDTLLRLAPHINA